MTEKDNYPAQPDTKKIPAVSVPRQESEDNFVPQPVTSEAAFLFVSGQLAEVASVCRATQSQVASLTTEVIPRLARLELKVFGSNPPPMPSAKGSSPGELGIVYKPSSPPLTKRMASSETATENLAQEISNLREEFTSAKSEIREVKAMNEQQSIVMGVSSAHASRSSRTRTYLGSRAAIKDLLALVTAIGVVLGLWRAMMYPTAVQPLPLSTTSSPQK